ncbi:MULTISPECIES: hypothetical protein [unclassified Methylobacterium]|jgi:hypothetical protein|uniref:hypothetical protein n=1 Tax=unclassified Methylobacterium TaxID=2615210 RepID=UPI0006F3B9B6|nr:MULTISPECIES: hypothetical protein [unclassified Methylobacterium]KQO59296.1 hypothetical protein ASF22_06375 [Methylobacterium sp. Leaf87]KQP34836.1 hypothetical protein ASF25_16095 [Methylobacterium sp. Leaf100]KQP58316.1 hypothetical protein ASF52_14610 [Methylobacterium sp. Leaf112]
MVLRSEDPPAPGNIAVETPPDSREPTTAMLKADIDSGRTGDKVSHYDPGLSQLGTDDEAAGNPPSAERVALARKAEAAPPRVRDSAQPHGRNAWVMPAFVGVALLIPTVVGVSLYLLR